MRLRRTGGTRSRRLRATVVAGVAGGLLGAVVRILARRSRRRREQREQAFSRASDGMWPPVPRSEDRSVRISADRVTSPAVASDGDGVEAGGDDLARSGAEAGDAASSEAGAGEEPAAPPTGAEPQRSEGEAG